MLIMHVRKRHTFQHIPQPLRQHQRSLSRIGSSPTVREPRPLIELPPQGQITDFAALRKTLSIYGTTGSAVSLGPAFSDGGERESRSERLRYAKPSKACQAR